MFINTRKFRTFFWRYLKISRSIDDLSYDLYKFSQKDNRTFTSQNKICLVIDLLYVFPIAAILQNYCNFTFKAILLIYCALIFFTYCSLRPLLKNDFKLSDDQAKELKKIIWQDDKSKGISDDLMILSILISMFDSKIHDNVLKLEKSLKQLAAFSGALVIPLLFKIFSKMELADLFLIFMMFVPLIAFLIFIVGRDVDTWELILTKKSFEYTNAKKELRFLKEYLKNSDKENKK